MKKEALRVTSTIPVAPTTLYFAWIDSGHHSSMTGATAKIEPVVGAKYSTCNGYVTGKLVILDLGRRIVMSWRTTDFPRDAADSRVEVHFETLGASTRLLILHTEIPEGLSEKCRALWEDKYVTPMRAYFSKFLPDPRNPPVRRPPPPPENDEEYLPAKGKRGARFGPAAKSVPSGKGAPPRPAASGPGVHKADAKLGKPAKVTPAPKVAAKPIAKAPPPKGKAAKPVAKPAKKPAAKKAPPPKKPAPKKSLAPKPKPKKPAPKPKPKKKR